MPGTPLIAADDTTRLYTNEAGLRVLEGPTHRFTEGGLCEVLIAVGAAAPAWREAQWETEVVGQLCGSKGTETTYAPVLRPKLRAGETLAITVEGHMTIVFTTKPV